MHSSSSKPTYEVHPALTPEDLVKSLESDDTSGFITGKDLLEKASEKLPSLLEPFLPKVGLASLVGGSDVGKSSFLRQLATSIALGESDFLGFPLNTKHRRAIYVSTEDDSTSISFLLKKLNSNRNLATADYEGLSYLFNQEDVLKKLDNQLRALPADIVILDAFGDLFDGRLNDSQSVRTFLKGYHQLATVHQCVIVFLHHTGKYKDEQAPSKHHIVGSQAFEAKMRMVVELRGDSYHPQQRHLCILKANYLPNADKRESYVLEIDDTLTFRNTGDRQSLESLCKPTEEEAKGYSAEKYELACQLKQKGFTYDQIATQIGYKSKSDISKLFAKFGYKPAA